MSDYLVTCLSACLYACMYVVCSLNSRLFFIVVRQCFINKMTYVLNDLQVPSSMTLGISTQLQQTGMLGQSPFSVGQSPVSGRPSATLPSVQGGPRVGFPGQPGPTQIALANAQTQAQMQATGRLTPQ